MQIFWRRLYLPLFLVTATASLVAQERRPPYTSPAAASPASVAAPLDYIVSAEDVLQMTVYDAADLDTVVRVSSAGQIDLPLLGTVTVAGRSIGQLQLWLALRYDEHYLQHAQVHLDVAEPHALAVTVMGAVEHPGVFQLLRPEPLTEVLTRAGSLSDQAGDDLLLTRRDHRAQRIEWRELQRAPENSPILRGGETISVPRAGLVYVLGEVVRPGGFPLNHNHPLTVLGLLALAQGLKPAAAVHAARLVAHNAAGRRNETRLDLARILRGRALDPALAAEDVLVVPQSGTKAGVLRGLDAVVAATVGIAIYHH